MNAKIKKPNINTEAQQVNVSIAADEPVLDPNPVIDGSLFARSYNTDSSSKNKRVYLIIGGVIVVGVVLYFMFKKLV